MRRGRERRRLGVTAEPPAAGSRRESRIPRFPGPAEAAPFGTGGHLLRAAKSDNDIQDRGRQAESFARLSQSSVQPRSGGTLTLATGAGALTVAPREHGPSPAVLRPARGPNVAVIAGAGLVVRTAPVGLTTFLGLVGTGRDMPSWELELPGDERLVATGHGGAAVVAPARQTVPRATESSRAPNNPRAGSASPLSDRIGGAPSRALNRGERVVAVVSAPLVLDARRHRVGARLRISSDRVEIAIERMAEAAKPVAARIDWAPTGDLGNGWFAYGAARALRTSSYSIEGKRIRGLGCATTEQGQLDSGEEEESRQLAVAPDRCRSLIERGAP